MDDQYNLGQRIKQFLAQNSQFRNPNFDPAPFLIQILKQKQSDQQAILQRQKQLIQMQNNAFDIVDQICTQYDNDFFDLLNIPQKQAQQLQKLKSNISLVKKKVKQTKSLLLLTQRNINHIYLNCMFNKIIYRKLKDIQVKLNLYESASLALKNNQFLNCSRNLPIFQTHSILQSALAIKSQNLKLTLLTRAIQQLQLFLYLTPKIILPSSHSLIERISSQQSFFGNLNKHEGFRKRYNLFKKANSQQYLTVLWDFKQLQRKSGKIHMIFDVIKAGMNIGKLQEILQSLELDSKKSVNSIFLLIQYFFSVQCQQQLKNNKQLFLSTQKTKSDNQWFLCKKNKSHTIFISTVLNITGVMLRKLLILHFIIKQYQISIQHLTNLQPYCFFNLLLKQINSLIQDIYIKQKDDQFDYIHQDILKKIKFENNYIYWSKIRNVLIKSIIIIDQNIKQIENQYFFSSKKTKVEWDQIVKVDQFDKKFYNKFHSGFMKTLQQVFNHQGKSFSFQSLQQISNIKQINQQQLNFCKYFSSQQLKYSKQYVFTISLLNQINIFFTQCNFSSTKCQKYQLFLLSIFYLKLNYYIQRYLIDHTTLQKAYQYRKVNNKIKTKQKDLRRQFDKLCLKKKPQKLIIKPWKRTLDEDVQSSKYRLVQNLKGLQIQNKMLLSYCMRIMPDLEKYKQSQKVISQIIIFDKLQPTNYEQNFNSKLIKIWDQLPELQVSIIQTTLSLFQKFIQLHTIIMAVIQIQTSVE